MIENEKIKESIVKNSAWNSLVLLLNKIGGFVFVILLARLLLPNGYGKFSIIISLVMIFLMFFDPGVNYALTRYLSHSFKYEKEKIRLYYNYLFKLKLLFSIVSSLALIILSFPLAEFVYRDIELYTLFLIGAIYILFLSLENFYTFVVYSAEKTKYIMTKEAINQFLKILMVLIITYFIGPSNRLKYILVSFILISSLSTLYLKHNVSKFIPEKIPYKELKIEKDKIRKFIRFMILASIGGVLFSYTDLIILGIFVSPEYVGYYKAALTLVLGIAGLATFPNMSLLTSFTKLNDKKLQLLFNKIFRYVIIFSIPSTFGLIVLGKYIIVLFYGNLYLNSIIPLYFLSFILLPALGNGIFFMLFLAKDKSELFTKSLLITSIIAIIFNFGIIKILSIYSKELAIMGAALATTISWIAYFLIAVFFIKRKMKIAVSFKIMPKAIISSVVMFLFFLFIIRFINEVNIFKGLLLILLGIVVYITVMVAIKGVEKKDIYLVRYLKGILANKLFTAHVKN